MTYAFVASLSSPTALQPPGVPVRVYHAPYTCPVILNHSPISIPHSKNLHLRRHKRTEYRQYQRQPYRHRHLHRYHSKHKHFQWHLAPLWARRQCRLQLNNHSFHLGSHSTTSLQSWHRAPLVPVHHRRRRRSCPHRCSSNGQMRSLAPYRTW